MGAILDLKHFHLIRYCGAEVGRPPGAADPSIHSQCVPGRRLHLPGCLETGLKCVTWLWTPPRSPQGDTVLVALSCDKYWEHPFLCAQLNKPLGAAHFNSTSLSLRGFIQPVFCVISITLPHHTHASHSQCLNSHSSDMISHLNAVIWFQLIEKKIHCNKETIFFTLHEMTSSGRCCSFVGHTKERLRCDRTLCQVAQGVIDTGGELGNQEGKKNDIFRLRKNG